MSRTHDDINPSMKGNSKLQKENPDQIIQALKAKNSKLVESPGQ